MRFVILAALLSMGSTSFAASVNPDAADGVAAIVGSPGGEGALILCADGQMWSLAALGGSSIHWEPYTYGLPLPVPVSQIAEFAVGNFTTVTGEHWVFVSVEYPEPQQWRRLTAPEMPPLPCGATVQSDRATIGGVKSLFR